MMSNTVKLDGKISDLLDYFIWFTILVISVSSNDGLQSCDTAVCSVLNSAETLNYETQCPYHSTLFYKGGCLECVRLKDVRQSKYNVSAGKNQKREWNFWYISYEDGPEHLTPIQTPDGPVAICPSSQSVIHLKRYRDGVKALNHKIVKVVTVQRAPFSTISNGQYSGVMFDILKVLQVKHNFSLEISLPPDGNFGSLARDESGRFSWNGMVGQVFRKEADIGAASFSMTLERSQVVDFTMAIHQEPTSILIPAPTAGDKFTILIRPFEPEVWGSLFLTIFLLAPAFYILHKISLHFSTGPEKNSAKTSLKLMSEIFMFITGSLVQESVTSPVKRTRFLVAVWWMLTLVLSNTYVGFLVSFLSAPKLYNRVNSLEELVHQNALKWTFRKGTAHHNLFKSEKSVGVFKLIGDGVTDSELATSDVEGITKALSGKYTFIKEKSFLEFALSQDFELVKHCRVTLAKEEFFTVGIGFIVPKRSPILPLLNSEISNVIATGLMEQWKKTNWPQNLWCVDAASYIISTQPHSRKLNLGDFEGVSFLWVCGITSALIGFTVEHLIILVGRTSRSTQRKTRLQFTI